MARSAPAQTSSERLSLAEPSAQVEALTPSLITLRLRILPGSRHQVRLLLDAPTAFLISLGLDQAPDWSDLGYDDWAPYILGGMKPGFSEIGWWIWWLVERGEPQGTSDRLVGYLGFKGQPSSGGNVEITYGIAPSVRRRGLMSEGLAALTDWAFRSNRVRRIIATVDPENTASLRTLQKLGFRIREDESDEDQVVLALAQ